MATYYSEYSNTYRLILELSETKLSDYISTNKTRVNYTLKCSCGSSYAQWNPGPGDFSISINGSVVKTLNNPSFFFSGTYSTITIASGYTDITHNNDGSKTVSFSASYKAESTANYLPGNMSLSGNFALTTIPRASSINSITTGIKVTGSTSVTVDIDRKSSSFTNTVEFKANDTYKATFTGVETSKEYTIPVTWINAIGSNSSLTCTCTVTTYNGSTQIGSAVSTTFVIYKADPSTVTCTSAIECNGSNILRVGITRSNTAFLHTVVFTFGSYSQSFTNIEYLKEYAPSMTWLNAIPNSSSGTGTVTVTTYYGSISLGSNSKTFTLTVPSSVIPTISSVTLTPVNSGNLSSWGICVQNLSQLSVAVSAGGSYSSTISKYYINGVETTSNPYTIAKLTTSGTLSVTVKVVDSRGRESAEITRTITVYEYKAPTLTVDDKNIYRSNSDGSINDAGAYLSITATFSCSSCNGKNTISTVVNVREVEVNSYTSKGSLTSGKKSILSGFSTEKAYDIWIIATDTVGNVSEHHTLISAQKCYWSFLPDHKGFAVGVIATHEDTFEIGYKTTRLSNSILEQVSTYDGTTVTSRIGAQNQYYCQYTTDAVNGHYFGQKVTVDNDLIVTGHADIGSEKVNGSLEVGGNFITDSVNIPNSYLMKQFHFIGTNLISSASNDIPNNWIVYKNSLHWINQTGILVDQPYKYGTLLSMVNGNKSVTQIFIGNDTNANGMYYRSGYDTAWYGTWKRILDDNNYKDLITEIHDTGWVVLWEASATSECKFAYRKKNGIVTVVANSGNHFSIPKNSWKDMSQKLPAECRPSFELLGVGTSKSTSGYYIQFNIKTDGTVSIYNTNPNSACAYWSFVATYAVD